TSAIQPGKPFQVGVLLKLAPKWHVYWINPGDAGIATTVDFHLPEGVTASPLQYPVPSRIEQSGGVIMYCYTNEVMLISTITPPADFKGASAKIDADLNYLVCEDSCIQGSAKLSLSLPMKAWVAENQKELFATWQARMPATQAKEIDKVSTSASA